MPDSPSILTGRLTAPDYRLPTWATDRLHLVLWDRDSGPEAPLAHAPARGPHGEFRFALTPDAALTMALTGPRQGPRQVVSVGWGDSLDPILAELSWPTDYGPATALGWRGEVSLIGYVEQLHAQEMGELGLAVLELAAHVTPITYRRLPPLPLPGLGDRHGLHVDRPLEDRPEQVYYALAEVESPLVTLAQDALISNLKVVCVASLGEDEGRWDEVVNVPLLVEGISLLAP